MIRSFLHARILLLRQENGAEVYSDTSILYPDDFRRIKSQESLVSRKKGTSDFYFADITQLGECFPYKEEVVGSRPSISTIGIFRLTDRICRYER